MADDAKSIIPIIMGLVFVGILVSLGILLFNELGQSTKNTVTVTSGSFTVPQVNGTAVQLSGATNISSSVVVANSTGSVLSATKYSINTVTGKLTLLTNSTTYCRQGATCYATFTWLNYNTITRSATNDLQSAIAPVTTTWLSLIVTVSVLAIILGLVLTAFSFNRGRE